MGLKTFPATTLPRNLSMTFTVCLWFSQLPSSPALHCPTLPENGWALHIPSLYKLLPQSSWAFLLISCLLGVLPFLWNLLEFSSGSFCFLLSSHLLGSLIIAQVPSRGLYRCAWAFFTTPPRWCPSSQSYGFSCGHVWMWELDYKESWAPKNWCFRTVVLENSWESLGLQGDPTSPS